jgi:glycosyltransferase involved in cell wall biosynthesis
MKNFCKLQAYVSKRPEREKSKCGLMKTHLKLTEEMYCNSKERWMLKTEKPTISVIIPAFKEGKTIREVIKEIKESTPFQTQIIVVDGCSNDGTEEITEEENVEMISEPRRGYGKAISTGLAHGNGDIIVIIDADSTYETRDIDRLVSPLIKDEVDICLASRIGGIILPGAMHGINYVGNRVFTMLFNQLYRQRISDTQAGFRAMTKGALKSLDIKEDGMGISAAVLTQAARNGLKIAEVPTTYKPRNNHSKSKLNRLKAGYDILRILLFG